MKRIAERNGRRFVRPTPAAGLCLLSCSLLGVTRTAHASNNGLAPTPPMGWSSWSYFKSSTDLTETTVKNEAQVMSSQLKSSGYAYINIDDYYYLDPNSTVDTYGRWVPVPGRFPSGMASLASYIHGLGLKFGMYVTPGIPGGAVSQNTPIQGTSYHAKDIADTTRTEPHYGPGTMYYINYSKAGAQQYINSWANLFASWGVDYIKLDGINDNNIPDLQAWSAAIAQSGRPMVLGIANNLDSNNAATWKQYANAWRIDGDVECYCSTLVMWSSVPGRMNDAPRWANAAGPGGWNDLDSINVGNGTIDGLTNIERQSAFTFWALQASPLMIGDDLRQLDSYGVSLLTNSEVVAVDQAGAVAVPANGNTQQEVWTSRQPDGTYAVGMFNLSDNTTSNVTAYWSTLGFTGSGAVRDLWSHTNLGAFQNSFTASLAPHESRLIKVTASPITPLANGTYSLTPGNATGSRLDAAGSGTSNGTAVDIWPSNNQTNQKWIFTNTGNGMYKIQPSYATGLALDVYGINSAAGATVDLWQDNGGTSQRWSPLLNSNGTYRLMPQCSPGMVLDVYNNNTSAGTLVETWYDTGNANQQWAIH